MLSAPYHYLVGLLSAGLLVSPNIVWTFIPAVSTSLKNAVFAFCFVEKLAFTQKVHYHYDLQTNFFSLCSKPENTD
jgi:NO-binding membrane sensor protein with MHYT domain